MRRLLVAPDSLAVLPLLQGLGREDSPLTCERDLPSSAARRLAEGRGGVQAALITPIEYARHGGSYRVVPGIAVSAAQPSGSALLRIRPDARVVRTVAVDLRSSSDIVLALILLNEKFPPAEGSAAISVVPVEDASQTGFDKADAILVSRPAPAASAGEGFVLDLYEEWTDLTDLPYVAGFWTTREMEGTDALVTELRSARDLGTNLIDRIAADAAGTFGMTSAAAQAHLRSFDYTFDDVHQESVDEFFRYAYFHGILGDVPELRFFDSSEQAA